jgi:NADH dehydrogenase
LVVSLFGGTGFVGSYVVEELIAGGHQPRPLVRPGSEPRMSDPAKRGLVSGDLSDPAAIMRCLEGAEAVIYLVGILREFPDRGVTFEELHHRAAERVIRAAESQGVSRFILMSANGVRSGGTAYQATKYRAEDALKSTGLDWTIFRPSVIFGDPRGRMEFCTQLRRDIIDSPFPAPLFYPGLSPLGAGGFQLAPVHVRDVARAFTHSLGAPETTGRTFQLCGPDRLTWKEILTTIAAAVGRTKLMLPVPAMMIQAVASMLDSHPWFPITRDQLAMLLEGNVCDEPGAFDLLGIEPARFGVETLTYLTAQ